MSRFGLVVIGFVLLILDVSLGGLLTLGSIRPSLTLPLIVYVGLLRGPIEGTLFGLAVGLGQDVLGALPLGASALTYCAIGFLCGKLWDETWIRLWWPWGIYLAIAAVADQAFSHYLLARAAGCSFLPAYLATGLPSAAYTTVLGLLWYVSPFHKVRPA
ncbi:hypothetical protein KKH27_01645 [bacterium]|nr:hypothetical protein [bacterium]MBU1983680.1 hypothetical protein [bacterium]